MSEHKGYTDVQFVQVVDGQSFVIRCRYCEGTGRRAFLMDKDRTIVSWVPGACRICEGKGMLRLTSLDIPVNPPSATWIDPCKLCIGYGIQSLTGKIERIV